MNKLLFFVFILFLTTAGTLRASHNPGGSITYDCVGPNQYLVTLTLFEDCGTAFTSSTDPMTLVASNTCGYTSGSGTDFSFAMTNTTFQQDVSQLCPAQAGQSECQGGTIPGIWMHQWQVTVTLPGPCDTWTFSYSSCCVNTTNNLSGQPGYYFPTTLNSNTSPCNSSADVTAPPIPYVCVNQPVSYSLGGTDPNGNTLSYQLVPALSAAGTPVPYLAGFSGTSPIQGIVIDPNGGILTFTPTALGNYVVAVQITETDANGQVVGTVVHQFQVEVINCTNQAPQPPVGGVSGLSGLINQTGSNSVNMCVGQNGCFNVVFSDNNAGNIITLTSNVATALPGATINFTGTNPATATICWTPPVGAPAFQSVTINAEDNACPIAGINAYVVEITVNNNCCAITSMTATPSACNPANNQYSLSGQIAFTLPPTTGTLTVTSSCGGSQTFNAPFTSPLNYNLTGLTANGAACTVTATFSATPTCTFTQNFTAPAACTPCSITSVTATPGACVPATGQYALSGSINFTNPPATGTLTVTNSCGGSQTFNAPFTSPLNYNITGLTADGAACTVTATFSASPACTNTANYTAPAACNPCAFTGINISIGACNAATNTYDATGSVTFNNAPTTGTLTITGSCGGTQTFNAPFTSPTNFALNGINADGSAGCSITATFSAAPACTITSPTFTEPVCPCNLDFFDVNIGVCDPVTNTYPLTGNIEFTSPPASGQLIVETCEGLQQVFNAPFTSPLTYSIPGNTPGLATCDIQVYFTANPACQQTITFTPQPNCLCPADAGTYTGTITGSSSNNYVLCFGDQITINSNGDFTYPADVNDPTIPYNPGIWYLIYSCPPTIGLPDITADPCLEGVIETSATFTDINDLSLLNSFPAGTFTNNTVYIVPITMYDVVNGYYSVTNWGGYCYDLGQPFAVQYLPQITATGVESCAAGTVTVTVSGGLPALNGSQFTATLNSPATASLNNSTTGNNGTIVISGLQNGDMYSVTITDDNGCPVTYTGGPFVGPTTPVLTPAGPFCLSDPAVNLSASIAGGTWTGNGITNATSGTFTPSSAGIGTHTVTYTPTGCTLPNTMDIVVNDEFDATITPAGPFCESDAAVTLAAVDAGGTWSGNGITDANAGTFDPNTAGPGTHTITYTITGTCGDSQTTTITVNPDADATINPVGPFCTSDPAISLTAAQAGGVWSGTGVTNTTTGIFDPSIAGAGNHIVTYTIAGACGDTQTTTISVSAQLDATITPAGPFCESNASVTLVSVDGGGTWSGNGIINASTGQFDPNTAGPGTHTITYTVGTGTCSDTQTTDIQVIADADATVTPAGPYCMGDPDVTLTSAEAGGVWSGTGITNAATGIFSPVTAGVGTHTITYTISGVCGDVGTINIIVNDTANSTINAAGPFCVDAPSVNLTAAQSGGTWSGNGITNSTNGTFDPSVAGVGTHTITYTIGGACGTSSTTTIVVNPLPVVSFSVDNASGCVPLTATITNTSVPAGVNCQWLIDGVPVSGSCTSFSNTYTIPGCYDVALQTTDANGCSNSAQVQDMICVFPDPVADFSFSPTDATVLFPQVNFTNQSTGASTYDWDFAGLGSSTDVNPSFVFPDAGAANYQVCLTATSNEGCVDSICKIVNIYDEFLVYVPNAFTPDPGYDAINTVFMPVVSGHDPEAYEFMIFNRWGELIFSTQQSGVGWDGTHKGKMAQQDVYVWKLKVKRLNNGEKKEYYGHVTLLK